MHTVLNVIKLILVNTFASHCIESVSSERRTFFTNSSEIHETSFVVANTFFVLVEVEIFFTFDAAISILGDASGSIVHNGCHSDLFFKADSVAKEEFVGASVNLDSF